MFRKQITIYLLWLLVEFTAAYIKLKELDGENLFRNQIANWDERIHPTSYEDLSVELFKKAFQIIQRDKNTVSTVEINNCLSKYNGNTNKKLKCVKRLIAKHKASRNAKHANDRMDFYKEDIPFKRKHRYNPFTDLKFSGNGNRSINDLTRFSNDYFDADDMLRSNAKMVTAKIRVPLKTSNTKNRYVFKLTPIKDEDRYALDLTKSRKFGYNNDFVKKKILRTLSDESGDSDSSGDSSPEVTKKVKEKMPKRFEVIDKSKDSNEDSDSGDNVPMQRPIASPKKENPVVLYMQAPTRILKINRETRRRLPHFFPKRYHWDEEDMRNLINYWFNGPQGKYWGHHKTPY